MKEKKDKQANEMEYAMNYKGNSNNYHYKTNNLLTNLVLDEIYKERNVLLQSIRYIMNNNFFD